MRSSSFGILVGAAALALAAPALAQTGHFDRPVEAVWMPDGRHMVLTKSITFTDSQGRTWPVPAGTETDGASIPQPFWWIIGGPFEGKYRQAAVIHDFYCDVRRRTWQDVDHMFLDAMLSAGVPSATAKAMFFAVWSEGPQWDAQTLNNVWISYPPDAGPSLVVSIPDAGAPGPGPHPGVAVAAAAPPPAYLAAKTASLAAHNAHLALASLALEARPPAAGLAEVLHVPPGGAVAPAVRHPSNDPHDIAAWILAADPPLAEVEKEAEAARMALSAPR